MKKISLNRFARTDQPDEKAHSGPIDRRRFIGHGLAGMATTAIGFDTLLASTVDGAGKTLSKQTVAVLGGTGRTGSFVLEALVGAGHRVRAISRRAGEKAARPGIEWVSADVTKPETLVSALDGADSVIFAVGVSFQKVTTQTLFDVYFGGVEATAMAAKRVGAKRVVLMSSAGSVRRDKLPPVFLPSMDAKSKGESALRASGIEYTICRTAGLWDRPGREHGILFLQSDDVPHGGPFMICREDCAHVLAECAISGNAAYKTFIPINAATSDIDGWRGTLAELERDPAPATS
jgi:uncharacterized protein YbjT (DUF2867 family)